MRLLSMLLACLLVFSGSACAEKYVYWNGTIDLGKIESLFGEEALHGLHAWDYETDRHSFLEVDAYPTDSDEQEGILAVEYSETEWFTKEITVYRCIEAAVAESWKITLPDTVDKVYAIKDGWVYYSYVVLGEIPEEERERIMVSHDALKYAEEYGIRRYHVEEQIVQNYVDLPGVISVYTMPDFSVGVDGEIAFQRKAGEWFWGFPEEDSVMQLYVAKPEETPVLIKEVGNIPDRYNDFMPVWLDDGRLMYMHPAADEFWVYDGISHAQVGAAEIETLYYEYDFDDTEQYIASHIYAPERVIGEIAFYRLQLVSLADGKPVCESDTWVWFDGNVLFGN